ncbi:MAG TPA: ABC transporter substrate-binding protein [Chloroflexota bacterium]|nr:ABC transporter substrate-binding protein [Chloroflexota bacterium]
MTKLSASALAFLMLLSACGGTAAPSASSVPAASKPAPAASAPASASAAPSAAASAKPAASAAASGLTKINVSYSNIVSLELPVWSALEGGIFSKNGLDVNLRLLESSQGLPAMIAGEIQISDIAGGQVVDGAAAGVDVVDVLESSPVYPYVFLTAPDIKDAAGLKGKKVGVSSIGSASDVATRVLLKQIGLTPDKDVTVIAVGSATARTAALLNGAIQGGVQLPPDQLQLQAKGFNQLYDMADLKNLPNSNTTEMTRRSYINSNREAVQKYVDSLVQSIARVKKDKPFAVSVLKKYFKSEDDNAMSVAYDYAVSKVIPSQPIPKPEQLKDAQDVIAQKNEKAKGVDLSKLVDPSFVQSAVERGLDKG